MRPTKLILPLLFICFSLSAQTAMQVANKKINPLLLNGAWKAEWITHPGESVVDYGVFHFRKDFELKIQPAEFIVHISADNRYRLFVNGVGVCFGPERADPEHWHFESIDLAPFLKSGRNVLAAVVWNFGELKPWAQFSIKTAFILQGNGAAEEVANTDKTWKVIKDEAYSPAPASSKETSGQFVVVGLCDKVDATLYPWNWEKPDFNDSSWLTPRTLDAAHARGVGTDINWELTPRRIPMMEQRHQQFATVRRTSGAPLPDGFLAEKTDWTIPPDTEVCFLSPD